MGRLTTHVLDTAQGRPGEGIRIDVYRLEGESRSLLKTATTNDDGRCDAPILEGDDFSVGEYELVFHAGDYLRRQGVSASEPRFLDVIPLRFGVADASQHYHVPLLVSPYGYSTYRGS
ncbi:hydroxyisourate hydrolase [Halomonas sp. MCCC 1A17488]|uniref:5-hydroxyisourate hydrolase n=1 Tax=Billgrantia sulfidoxydans TaxID=2733484 RepID=A0ABX7W705_9GAMM|nr:MULTISPECIES: hydroxyisourate hydrolase [Halomonas]MCE8017562.1 hydroxyisourate hydrolase [Halomonas sp. MCCC 1A17488]MCG3240895.1 hydroxyisourate hydrolase [Halomonas sp. MCCC 1A17488]QPP48767.1 hydroxyisourate hydrolase [Halomonas sp. SS10-MC5]QTP56104.1 hydroxyisourate hydrolase [Halomonas sulfidoxydans]